MRKLFICLMSLLTIFSSTAQDWKKDLLAMNKAYLDASSFSMNVQVQSYNLVSDITPQLNYKGKVASSKNNYYTSIMGKTSLYTQQCALLVDSKQKIILYQKNDGSRIPQGGFSIAQLDSAFILMGKNMSVKYLVNTASEKRLQLSYKDNMLSKVELSINPETNTITQLVYYYNTKHPAAGNSAEKVVVSYTGVELNKNIDNSLFSEKKYVTVKKNKVVPAQAYASYKLINPEESLSQK